MAEAKGAAPPHHIGVFRNVDDADDYRIRIIRPGPDLTVEKVAIRLDESDLRTLYRQIGQVFAHFGLEER